MILQEVLLITEEYVKKYSTVSDNMDAKYIVPCIVTCQVQNMQPLIGTELSKALCNMVNDNSINEADNSHYKELLDEYVQPYLLAATQAELIISNMAKIRNAGNVQYLDTNQSNITMKDMQYLSQHYSDQAAFLGNRLTDYLRCNMKKFPEYCHFCNCCGGMQADPHTNNKINLVL